MHLQCLCPDRVSQLRLHHDMVTHNPTYENECPSIPASQIGAVGLCVGEGDNNEGAVSPPWLVKHHYAQVRG